MVQVIVILIFATLHAHDLFVSTPPEFAPWVAVGAAVGGVAILWTIFHVMCGVWGRALDGTGRVSIVRRAERSMLGFRLMAAAVWGMAVFGLGFLDSVRGFFGDHVLIDEALATAPLLGFIIATWFSIYPLELRLREATLLRELSDSRGLPVHPPLTRTQYVLSNVRHQMLLFLLPLSLMSAWEEMIYMHIDPWLSEHAGGYPEVWSSILQYAGMLTVLIISPALMRRVWNTVALGDSALRDQARAMCRQYRVRVQGPLLWRTHGSMVNAAILGVFWPLRYMLLSDALLERLTAEQVAAVMAHEIAHVRRRHLVWLGVCILSSVMVMSWIARGVMIGIPASAALDHRDALSIVMSLAGLAGAGLVFTTVSRRFEWQADAFAVQHLSRVDSAAGDTAGVTLHAVGVMSSALQAVADLNGIDPRRFTWRHGSISERQRRLETLIDRPINRLPIDRQVAWIKAAAAVALLASLLPLLKYGVEVLA